MLSLSSSALVMAMSFFFSNMSVRMKIGGVRLGVLLMEISVKVNILGRELPDWKKKMISLKDSELSHSGRVMPCSLCWGSDLIQANLMRNSYLFTHFLACQLRGHVDVSCYVFTYLYSVRGFF